DRCEIREGDRVTQGSRSPIEELAELLRRHQAVALPGLPRFCGGAVGYFGYDAVRWFERLPARAKDDQHLPDAVFMFGDVVSVCAGLAHALKVGPQARGGDDPGAAYQAAVARLEAEVRRLSRALPWEEAVSGQAPPEPSSTATREGFCRAVDEAKEHIRAGDI